MKRLEKVRIAEKGLGKKQVKKLGLLTLLHTIVILVE